MVGFLEGAMHVIGQLSNAMQGCVPDLWVRVLQVLHYDWDHRLNLLDLVHIHILTYLRECHDSCMFVPPVLIVCHRVLDEHSDQRQHEGLADGRHKAVNCNLTKIHLVIFLILSSEAFFGTNPVIINIFVYVDHELKNLLQDVLDECLVISRKARLSLDHGHNEFHWLGTNHIVSEV